MNVLNEGKARPFYFPDTLLLSHPSSSQHHTGLSADSQLEEEIILLLASTSRPVTAQGLPDSFLFLLSDTVHNTSVLFPAGTGNRSLGLESGTLDWAGSCPLALLIVLVFLLLVWF